MSRIAYVKRNGLDENNADVAAFLRKEISADELTCRIQMKACGGKPDEYEL